MTTRKGDRWVLPKGWPKRREPFATAAKREAEEEAGVIGTVSSMPIGEFTYRKTMRKGYVVRSHVFVFALRVDETRRKWREDKKRSRQWIPLGDAAGIVEDRDVARLLAEIAEGDALAPILAELDAARADVPGIQPASN